jgi:hypothetical protein
MFIPRHPVVENQFCSYGSSEETGGVGGVIAYAGSVVRLDPAATNQEPIVYKLAHGSLDLGYQPFGMLMQKVKVGYHQVHPTGFMMPGDLGSSDALAQPSYGSTGAIDGSKEVPVGVAHMGIWDTVHYTSLMIASVVQAAMVPGYMLYPAADEAKLTNGADSSTGVNDGADDKANGAYIDDVGDYTNGPVAMVVKGASLAKCQANFNNTTLYPIRVKIFV